MKKITILLLVVVLSMSTFLTASAAAPAPGGPFSSAFYVQNLEATAASCTYSFYNSTGTAVLTSASFTIAGGANVEVYTPSVTGLAAGSYSGVVSCDKQVAAIVNFSDPSSGASHSGISTPGTVWYAPNVYDNYYTYYSNVYAQNATGSPVDITLQIFAPGNPTPVYSNTKTAVPGYASVVWEQEGLAELSNNVSYSAKISGTGNIAPIVNIYGGEQLYSYNPFISGAKTVYVPMLYNGYYGFNTEMKIQNIGSGDAAVTITYSNGQTTNVTIPSNSGQGFYTPGVLPAARTQSYSAVVTSTQDVVVVVNESSSTGFASTYNGFDAGSTEVSFPVLYNGYYTFNTEVVCQNVGSAPTNIKITYNGTGAAVAPSRTVNGVQPGKTTSFYTPGDAGLGLPANYKGSGYATSSDANVKIACVVNEGSSNTSKVWDAQYTYNGILK